MYLIYVDTRYVSNLSIKKDRYIHIHIIYYLQKSVLNYIWFIIFIGYFWLNIL
jgi:hypothetical protein